MSNVAAAIRKVMEQQTAERRKRADEQLSRLANAQRESDRMLNKMVADQRREEYHAKLRAGFVNLERPRYMPCEWCGNAFDVTDKNGGCLGCGQPRVYPSGWVESGEVCPQCGQTLAPEYVAPRSPYFEPSGEPPSTDKPNAVWL